MIPVADTADLGRVIRDERKRQHMTQTELAGLSGVGITYLSQLENGKETAEIGKALNVLTMLGMDLYAERRA
ncbi:helix-turn-helix transcriptional regulator [Collinsella tanakaei]|nr:helix-turn-helix transcriptional regulator [Collinsella tanakaei]